VRITVVVPTPEYKMHAGARIRYGRLQQQLTRLGADLSLVEIDAFEPQTAQCDVLIISKCHDARSLLAVAALRDRGCLVGVDLFDDYFSQLADSRLTRFRTWFDQIASMCDFMLCSTQAISNVVAQSHSGLPIHIVYDPADDLRADDLPRILACKLRRAREERRIRISWFGMGNNPFFDVGLVDLASFADCVSAIGRKTGMHVELTILTNARALNADGLVRIRQLSVNTVVHEWTIEREREVLADSFACFLPVNAQNFSIAKSLNRAVTALSAGCQLISAGFPLYAALNDLIYRSVDDFARDFDVCDMRMSASKIGRYAEILDDIASSEREATRLLTFLMNVPRPQSGAGAPIMLFHGHTTTAAAHKQVQALGGLSVASPYCAARLGFDIIFREVGGQIMMLVSDRAAARLSNDAREELRLHGIIMRRKYWETVPVLSLSRPERRRKPWFRGRSVNQQGESPELRRMPVLPLQLATYRHTMQWMRTRIESEFGHCRILLSESSPFPFDPLASM